MNEVTAEQLQAALDSREEARFKALIVRCGDGDFNLVFQFTIKSAEQALKTSLFERDTLENMMESGLQRMVELDDLFARLGPDVRKLKVCVTVIENYVFPSNREKLLTFRRAGANSCPLGYLLWKCFPDIIYSRHFPKVKNFILYHFQFFLAQAYRDLIPSFVVNRQKLLENYFILLDALIRNNKLSANCVLVIHDVYANELFQCWRKLRSEVMTKIAITLHQRVRVSGVTKDIKQIIAKMVFHAEYENVRSLLLRSRELSVGYRYTATLNHILSIACEDKNVQLVKYLLEKGAISANLNLLSVAAAEGHAEVVRVLLKNGMDVNGVNNRTGLTILSDAVFSGRTEVVCVLLKNGADVNKCNRNGFTSFHTALVRGNIDIVRMLLEKGANVNAPLDLPPLYFMLKESVRDEKIETRFNDPELIVNVIKLLLQYGARIDQGAKSIVKDKPEILALLEQTEKERAEAKQAATVFLGVGNKYKRGIFASEQLKHLPPDGMRLIGRMIKAASTLRAA